jgi:hypothetical protein
VPGGTAALIRCAQTLLEQRRIQKKRFASVPHMLQSTPVCYISLWHRQGNSLTQGTRK